MTTVAARMGNATQGRREVTRRDEDGFGPDGQHKAGRTRRALAGSDARCPGLIGRGLARQAWLGTAGVAWHGRRDVTRCDEDGFGPDGQHKAGAARNGDAKWGDTGRRMARFGATRQA